MKEKPILFSGPMVHAIIDGRKTQTRRVLKPQPENIPEGAYIDQYHKGPMWNFWTFDNKMVNTVQGSIKNSCQWKCPYPIGTRFWVRETFFNSRMDDSLPTYFKADQDIALPVDKEYWSGPWKPSIFMPRWASRINLIVTDVRVERLQEICDEDCVSEGIEGNPEPPRLTFSKLWDRINGKKHPWSSNPWVWVVTFEKEAANENITAENS